MLQSDFNTNGFICHTRPDPSHLIYSVMEAWGTLQNVLQVPQFYLDCCGCLYPAAPPEVLFLPLLVLLCLFFFSLFLL